MRTGGDGTGEERDVHATEKAGVKLPNEIEAKIFFGDKIERRGFICFWVC